MQKRYELTPMSYAELTSAHQNLSGMIIDAATEMLAEKFWPDSAEDVTAADMYVTVVGDCSGINFKLQIETDSSDAPSGSVVGAASSAFAGPNIAGGATQWLGGGTNPVNLGASCTVALNQPYWKVLYVTSGAPDGSHSIQLRGNFNSAPGDERPRLVSVAPMERSERGAEAPAEAIIHLSKLLKRLAIIYYSPPF